MGHSGTSHTLLCAELSWDYFCLECLHEILGMLPDRRLCAWNRNRNLKTRRFPQIQNRWRARKLMLLHLPRLMRVWHFRYNARACTYTQNYRERAREREKQRESVCAKEIDTYTRTRTKPPPHTQTHTRTHTHIHTHTHTHTQHPTGPPFPLSLPHLTHQIHQEK